MTPSKNSIKNFIGILPFTAELYWLLRSVDNPLEGKYKFKLLHEQINDIVHDVKTIRNSHKGKMKIFIFATLHYWIENGVLIGSKFAAEGNDVTIAYLPFHDWFTPINRFDLQRQNIYTKKLLSKAEEILHPISLLDVKTRSIELPEAVMKAVEEVSYLDVQYTTQIEEVDVDNDLYRFRYRRNLHTAKALYKLLTENRPDRLVTGNGTIQEFGIAQRIARILKIPLVTYEFSDRKEMVWISQDDEVMRQNTDAMWSSKKGEKLSKENLAKVQTLFDARRKGTVPTNYSRQWQKSSARGGESVRESLGLDSKPIALLATNVIGDSLTLDRQVFSKTMTEWFLRTVQYFMERPEINLVIRIHPGERFIKSPSVLDVVQRELPKLPENIHIITANDEVNSYDLISIADVGLVYTTTLGMEMAMSGLPVIVSGQTHYRDRGFTIDPDSWVNYFKSLGHILGNLESSRLTQAQINDAWKYAYYFFYVFPRPFPWHLWSNQSDYKKYPMKYIFSTPGKSRFEETFGFFLGKPMDWKQIEDGS